METTVIADPATIASVAGVILSLALSYLPFVKTWYTPLPNAQKVTVTGILLILVAAGTLLYNCQGGVDCVVTNWSLATHTLIAALVANQSAYLIFVKPFKV